MRRFDVFCNRESTARHIPFFLLVQSELLHDLPTRVVVPLVRLGALKGPPASMLNPEFEVEGVRVAMLTQQLAGVPVGVLRTRVASLEDQRDAILRALDFLFSGI